MPDREPGVDDLPREPLHVTNDVRSGTRQTDVCRVDAEAIDQMQDAQLFVDRRHPDGRRLEAVAQGLVVKQDGPRCRRLSPVPVVNERMHES